MVQIYIVVEERGGKYSVSYIGESSIKADKAWEKARLDANNDEAAFFQFPSPRLTASPKHEAAAAKSEEEARKVREEQAMEADKSAAAERLQKAQAELAAATEQATAAGVEVVKEPDKEKKEP